MSHHDLPTLAASAGSGPGILPVLLLLAILLLSAKLLGELATRLGQPAILGELFAGLLLGPSVLDILSLPIISGEGLGEWVHLLGQVGVVWLMFAAGLETELSDLRRAGRPAMLGGVFGVVVPTLLGLGLGRVFGYPTDDAMFLGIVLSATSVSISAQTLLELGWLRTREGTALLGAAVIDDILVVALLSVFIALQAGGGTLVSVTVQLARMIGTLIAVGLLAIVLLPRAAEWASRLRVSQGLLAFVLAMVLLLAWMIEYLGSVAAITGAFMAGLGMGRSHLRDEIERGLGSLAYAFFVPLFLVDVGLQSNARALGWGAAGFATALIVVAIVSKVAGCGLGAWLGGCGRGAALRMGVGMISRGEVGLIVAGVGVAEGILVPEALTSVVLMILATSLITPALLRWVFSRQEAADAATG